ncbi:MAG: nuclear transport factor 2 family protein [Methanoregula sp.]|nr:nuclear transport factor 2 family protein [Methanoregula sp.]
MKLTEDQKAEVLETLHNYGTAYQKKDIKTLLALFSSEISGYGSGADEVILDKKDFTRQIKRDLSQATSISVKFSGVKIFGEGRIAWVTSKSNITFTLEGTKKQTICGRSTIVLRNTGSRFVIEQVHFSMPYLEQSAGQSFPGA